MKILLVNVWMDTERGGGTAERTRHLALHLTKLGCECSILTMGDTPWRGEFERAGVTVISTRYLGERFPIPLFASLRLFGLVREADVVVVLGFWFLLAPAACLVAHLSRTILVLCPAGSLTRFGRSALLKRVYYDLMGRRMLGAATSVMATTRQERDLLISDFATPIDTIFISPNGIDPPVGEAIDVELPAGRIILFVGRLAAIKAPDVLLEAFAQVAGKVPGALLVLTGPDHGLRAQLERRTHELGLSASVHFTGLVDERTRTGLLKRAELLVVPSHSEVMSLVALEAGAMGVPVVLTDQCGFDEVADIDGGLVVKADPRALAVAIERMMSDPVAAADKGQRLRKFVLTRYTWRSVAGDLLEKLSLLRSRNHRAAHTQLGSSQ